MAQFDAAADPARAIGRGQYVPKAKPLADRIVPRAELEPHATHLLTGGVGSGKTTQLLVIRDAISKLEDTTAVYIDVTLEQDIRQIRAGNLLLLVGDALNDLLPAKIHVDVKKARKSLREFIQGSGVWRHVDEEPDWDNEQPDDDGPPMEYIKFPGEITPPDGPGPLTSATEEKLQIINTLRNAAQPSGNHFVVLLDGLDRMRDISQFKDLVEQDIQALRSAGIGVVLVGPIDVIYSKEKATRDMFDAQWHLSPVDTTDPEGLRFLLQVLRKRASVEIMPDKACQKLAEQSGGVMRDLIKLARSSGYEAYTVGADQIGVEHVEAAADAQGRAQLQSVGQDGVEVLQRVRTKGKFIPTSDRDLALLASRNVLEYQNGAKIRYAVHPVIEPLLARLATP